MAALIANVALGRISEFMLRVNGNDPTNSAFIVALLSVAESNATLQDYDDLSTLLGAAGNTESAFTSYARKTIDDTTIVDPTIDDTNNRQDSDLPDQTWSPAGGAADETVAKALVNYDSDTTGGTDANILPVAIYDTGSPSTNGSDLVFAFNASGSWRAASA